MSVLSEAIRNLFASEHPLLEAGELLQFGGNDKVLELQACVIALLDYLPHQSHVPGLQLDIWEIYQMAKTGEWPDCVPVALRGRTEKGVEAVEAYYKQSLTVLSQGETIPMWDPRGLGVGKTGCAELAPGGSRQDIGYEKKTRGPDIGMDSVEEVVSFMYFHRERGVVSEGFIQHYVGDESFNHALWSGDQMHAYPNAAAEGPAGIELIATVPEPPVKRIYSGTTLGVSYKEEHLDVICQLVMRGGVHVDTGMRAGTKERRQLKKRFVHLGHTWTPDKAIPHMLTEKIDGTAMYLSSNDGVGWLVSRNDDMWRVLGLPNCALGFEYYRDGDDSGMFLTHVDQWKFPNVMGLEQLMEFGAKKSFTFKMRGGILREQNIKSYALASGVLPPYSFKFDGFVGHMLGNKKQFPEVFVATADISATNLLSLKKLWGEHVYIQHAHMSEAARIDEPGMLEADALPSKVCEYDFESSLEEYGQKIALTYLFDREDKDFGNGEGGLGVLPLMAGATEAWGQFVRYWKGVYQGTQEVEVEEFPQQEGTSLLYWQLVRISEYKCVMGKRLRDRPTGVDRAKSYYSRVARSYTR